MTRRPRMTVAELRALGASTDPPATTKSADALERQRQKEIARIWEELTALRVAVNRLETAIGGEK